VAENKALLLAFASLIGIFLISSYSVELEFTDLDELDSNMLNSVVHVRGFVQEFKEFGAGVKLLIEQDNFKVSVVYFEEIEGRKEMCADVIGEVKTYRSSLEIVASGVQLFMC